MVVLQGSLFDTGPAVALRPLDDECKRTDLSDGAWIEVRRSWVAGSASLFDHLLEAVPWEAEQRWMYDRVVAVPRLVRFYGEGDPLPDPILSEARDVLTEHYRHEVGGPFRTVGVCLYRDGADSVAWHGDRIGRGAKEDTLVAIGSLGAPRRMHLRPRGGRRALTLELGGGDLVVMGGSFQRTWEHGVPKTRVPVGPRISVQFRPTGVR